MSGSVVRRAVDGGTASVREDAPMTRDELARAVAERCLLHGSFTLRSGQVSDHYFDKYQFESDPTLLRAVGELLAPLVPDGTEVLAGLELGGVPVATALSFVTGLPTALVRKEAKTYGTARLAEGADIDGRRVLVVEDVVTTGGQVVLSTADLRARGAQVDVALCVIDRSGGDHGRFDEAGLALSALFTADDLLDR
jgi:orotate phosphoribosyltransferase